MAKELFRKRILHGAEMTIIAVGAQPRLKKQLLKLKKAGAAAQLPCPDLDCWHSDPSTGTSEHTSHLGNVGRYLIEHLPLVGHIDTFGCELTLLDADTHVALQDPIQEDLWENPQFCLVVHECFLSVECNEQLQKLENEDCPKAIRVPANDSGILEAKLSSLPHVFDMSGLTQGFTRSVDKHGGCHSLRVVSCQTQL